MTLQVDMLKKEFGYDSRSRSACPQRNDNTFEAAVNFSGIKSRLEL